MDRGADLVDAERRRQRRPGRRYDGAALGRAPRRPRRRRRADPGRRTRHRQQSLRRDATVDRLHQRQCGDGGPLPGRRRRSHCQPARGRDGADDRRADRIAAHRVASVVTRSPCRREGRTAGPDRADVGGRRGPCPRGPGFTRRRGRRACPLVLRLHAPPVRGPRGTPRRRPGVGPRGSGRQRGHSARRARAAPPRLRRQRPQRARRRC